jgi:2,3-bisphosphoglycerate-dependent phosphoglycerate mutase
MQKRVTHLVFLRHGETEYNLINKGPPEHRVIAGQFDTPLTHKGRAQAIEAAAIISKLPFLRLKRIISSDLGRAVETSELVKAHLRSGPVVEYTTLLRERYTGAFEGRRIQDLEREYPEYFRDPDLVRWRADYSQKAPGGENFDEVTKRIEPLLNRLLNDEAGDSLVVSHIRVICCALGWLLKLAPEQTVALKVPNGEPIIVAAENKKCRLLGKWTVEALLIGTQEN